MRNNKCIVTVLDTISETSMPLNEFVLYRYNRYKEDKQYIIVCSEYKKETITLPENLEVFYVENDKKKLKKCMKEILKINTNIIVHLHQIKSAMFFYFTMFVEKKNYKVLFTVHSLYSQRNIKYKISSTICSLMSDTITCVSNSSLKEYSKFVRFIKKDKIFAIQNGVDLDRINQTIMNVNQPIKNVNKEQKKIKTLVYVGRVIPIKNQIFLVNLIEKIKDCKLIFIGEEGNNKEISKLISSLSLDDRIKITGLVPREKVFQILQSSDIYVSSSTVEGLPISVLEALAIGLPAIISDIAPHIEISKKIEGIKVVSLNDEEAWITQINEYLNKSDEDLKKIGRKSKMCVFKYFSLDRMHKEYNQLYEKLI